MTLKINRVNPFMGNMYANIDQSTLIGWMAIVITDYFSWPTTTVSGLVKIHSILIVIVFTRLIPSFETFDLQYHLVHLFVMVNTSAKIHVII